MLCVKAANAVTLIYGRVRSAKVSLFGDLSGFYSLAAHFSLYFRAVEPQSDAITDQTIDLWLTDRTRSVISGNHKRIGNHKSFMCGSRL